MNKKEIKVKEKEKKNEKKVLKKIITFLLFIVALLLLYARFIGTKGLIIKEYNIIKENLPESFDGFKIVHFTDLHYGRTIDDESLKNIVEKINKLKPQVIIFTGDLIDKDVAITEKKKNTIETTLSALDPEIGLYAVKGNHDYENKMAISILESSGFTILSNSSELIYYKGLEPIIMVGLPSSIKDHPKYEDALITIEEEIDIDKLFNITLAHEPDQIKELSDYHIDIMLAGHSHGGQILIPFYGPVITPIGAKTYYDEHYKVDNTDLYISSGIGVSQINYRFLKKPSINVYRLLTK